MPSLRQRAPSAYRASPSCDPRSRAPRHRRHPPRSCWPHGYARAWSRRNPCHPQALPKSARALVTQRRAASIRTRKQTRACLKIAKPWSSTLLVAGRHACTARSLRHMPPRPRLRRVPNIGHTTRACPGHIRSWASARSHLPQRPQEHPRASEAHAMPVEWNTQALAYARRAFR